LFADLINSDSNHRKRILNLPDILTEILVDIPASEILPGVNNNQINKKFIESF
jgi:hypothetical protein